MKFLSHDLSSIRGSLLHVSVWWKISSKRKFLSGKVIKHMGKLWRMKDGHEKYHRRKRIALHWMASQIARFIGPTWGPHGSCRPEMGPMLAPWTLLSGLLLFVELLDSANSKDIVETLHLWPFVQRIHPELTQNKHTPDSKVHGVHLGPTGPRWAPCWHHEVS